MLANKLAKLRIDFVRCHLLGNGSFVVNQRKVNIPNMFARQTSPTLYY
jgi:hypothetical protein